MDMRIDLHLHTTASDGAWTPADVARGAAAGRLDVIAVADHDTTAGVGIAREVGGAEGLIVVPAVELSTTWHVRELHLLAYFVDPDAPALRLHEERALDSRLGRMERMVSRLRKSGVMVGMDAVLDAAGRTGVVGRPHLARALVDGGHVASIEEAFGRYIGDGLPAFEPTALLDPLSGVEVARAAGGMAVWAHPPGDLVGRLLPELVRAGLRGLEVYRPLSTPEQIRRLAGLARSAGLFVTGGSDWHSPERNEPLGAFHVPGERVAAFLEAGGV